MVFITVGTHEQPFNRLIECADILKRDKKIEDEVIIQTGFSTYEPKYCKWSKLISYEQMIDNIKNARIVITHGGPASFIMPLQYEKIPIVVPRQKKFNEHVNDHQVDFVRNIAERKHIVIPVYEIEELENVLENYEMIIDGISNNFQSNNQRFNDLLDNIVQEMFG